MEIFKYLKVSMGNYVLHSYFHSKDMENVDIFLGYPWMKSMGIVNINAKKKFLNPWYKKRKITLQDVSHTKQEALKGLKEEVSTWNLELIPIDTSDDESMVAKITYDTPAQDDMPQDWNHSEKEYQVEELHWDVHQTRT